MGKVLQGSELRPIVVKTTLAGGIDPIPANQLPSAQVMLATALAGGFSGTPIFSTSDGVVWGMVASKPLESSEEGVWPAGLSLAVTPSDISAVLRSGIDATTRLLKEALINYLKAKESNT